MEDYINDVIVLFLVLILCIYLFRKDFKNWKDLDLTEKLFAIRGVFILVLGIILLVMKIVTD